MTFALLVAPAAPVLAEDAAPACHEVTHVMGTSCVPNAPQRIVVLDATTALPTLLDLGITPVGAVKTYEGDRVFADYIPAERLAGIAMVGSMMEFDIEAIAALKPDLIIGDDYFAGPVYDQFSQLAPTVVIAYPWYRPDWDVSARLVAETVGKADVFDAAMKDLRAEIASVATRLKAENRPHVLSRLDIWQDMPLYHHFECTWFGTILLDLGITQPASQQGSCDLANPDTAYVAVSPEMLTDYFSGGDMLLVYEHEGGNAEATATAWPVWNQLDAVKAGHVFYAGDAWGVGTSISAARRIVSDVNENIFPAAP